MRKCERRSFFTNVFENVEAEVSNLEITLLVYAEVLTTNFMKLGSGFVALKNPRDSID